MSSFALIPAAGLSTRMGQPKLLLPLDGQPLILRTLAAWQTSGVDRIVVVVRPDDVTLANVVRRAGVELAIPPVAPLDMKASLRFGLAHIAATWHPGNDDVWLVAPADMPGLSPRVIDRLLASGAPGDHPSLAIRACESRILIPTLAGRRGHPVLLPWRLAAEVERLANHEGLNSLISRHNPLLVACDDVEPHAAQAFADIDTPGELDQFRNPRLDNRSHKPEVQARDDPSK